MNLKQSEFSKKFIQYNEQFLIQDKKKLNYLVTRRISTLIDKILSLITNNVILGTHKSEVEWINYCLWYNLCGIHHVLSFLDMETDPENILNEVAKKADDKENKKQSENMGKSVGNNDTKKEEIPNTVENEETTSLSLKNFIETAIFAAKKVVEALRNEF